MRDKLIKYLIGCSLSGLITSSFASTYSREQVAKHADEISCWIVIEGKVYDVTSYLAKHPKKGRKELIESCGKDATDGWKNKGEKKKPHSKKAEDSLKRYQLGEFKD